MPRYDFGINLEHVLPKKPDGKWPQFSDDQADVFINRLGNQALMMASGNSDLRSAAFVDKRKVYSASPYVLTSQIAELNDWSAENISIRQKALAEMAIKAWPT